MSRENSTTLVAIAKNEGRYIKEWIAYNLAIGFSNIIIYSNDSVDEMNEIVAKISTLEKRVSLIEWPTITDVSPQVSAYNDSLSHAKTDWLAFMDIDEFLVPFADGNVKNFLDRVPDDVSSVHINWRNFGSGGRESENYDFVTKTFFYGADPSWGNHNHFKSIARTNLITDVHIHDIGTSSGRRVLSDFYEFEMPYRGLSNRIVHAGIQVNHYQCKTYEEFRARMLRGDANFSSDTPRDHSRERFDLLDRNETLDKRISAFEGIFDIKYNDISQ